MVTLLNFPPLEAQPIVSIILPIRNEAHYIDATLAALSQQTYRNLEIIVADGLSDDGTLDRVQSIIQAHPDRTIQLIQNPQRIFSSGFNIGLTQAHGNLIMMMGGHTQLPPDYITQCVKVLQETDSACVGGITHAMASASTTAQQIAAAMSSPFGVGNVAFRTTSKTLIDEIYAVDTVAFGMYRREVFDQIGDLDEELVRNQDDEFNYRLRKAGGIIRLITSLEIEYSSRADLGRLYSQYHQYGYWKVRVLQKHFAQMSLRHFIPPLFAAFLLVGGILALIFPIWRAVWVFGLAIYAVANLGASIYTSWQHQQHYPLLPIIFLVLHFSYGFGFLRGLFRFANRWDFQRLFN